MSMPAKPNGGWHPYESPHEQRRVARAVAAVCSMGRFIFLCGSPDQDAAALHDCVPARCIGRRDPERVGESRRNENARRQPAWLAFFAMGLLNNAVPFCLVVWGQSHIASGLAAILNATTPISTVIVAHLLTDDEKMTGNRFLGVVIGLFGVVVLVGPDSLKGLGTNVLAQVAVLTAAVFYAFAGVYGRRFKLMGIDPILTANGQVTASAIVLFPIVMLVDHPWTLAMPALPVWEAIAGSAVLSTALGYVLYFRILATAGATNLLLVTFLIPASAIIMGTFGLGERLDVRHFAGLAFIGAGLVAIDGRLLARIRRLRPARRNW